MRRHFRSSPIREGQVRPPRGTAASIVFAVLHRMQKQPSRRRRRSGRGARAGGQNAGNLVERRVARGPRPAWSPPGCAPCGAESRCRERDTPASSPASLCRSSHAEEKIVRTCAGSGDEGTIASWSVSAPVEIPRSARSGSVAAKLRKSCSPSKTRAAFLSASTSIGQGHA